MRPVLNMIVLLFSIEQLAVAPIARAVDDDHTLAAPEQELGRAKTDLKNLQSRLQAAAEVPRRLGLGPQTMQAERSFQNAKNFFRHLEFLSTIRELNVFLNLTQVPESVSYMEAHYMLGRSYEEVGFQEKALRAYYRYLQTFLTAETKNYGEMLDVMRRMIPLSAGDAERNQVELNALLSSLTNVQVPEEVSANVFYFAAKAAVASGQRKIASTWLATSLAKGDSPAVEARSLYLQALLALANKNYQEAEEILGRIMTVEEKDGVTEEDTKNLARLAMARVAVHRKKPETALKYYAMVAEKSPSFREAIFESVYVHLEVDEDQAARSKAMLYLARYPDARGAFQMRTLLAYLDLRAGNVEDAAAGIQSTNGKLSHIDTWMRDQFSGKDTINHEDMVQLFHVTGQYIEPTRTASEAFKLFQRLAEIQRRLADTRGEMRNMIYTIGRVGLATLRPDWVNRAEQLAYLSNDLMRIGHRVAATERHLFADRLTAVDKMTLDSSESRRTRLLTKPAAMRRTMSHWASLANFLELTGDIAKQSERLAKVEAELASARFLLAKASEAGDQATRQKRIKTLNAQAKHLDEVLGRTLELLRRGKAEDYLNQSPHRAVRKFLSQYAVALNEEAALLEKAREFPKTTAERMSAQDSQEVWEHWKFLAKETYTALNQLDADIKLGLEGIFSDLDSHELEYRRLSEQLRLVSAGLEAELGGSVGHMLGQYSGAIGERLAQHQKWRADLDWLGYGRAHKAAENVDKKYALEQQMLHENLSDLQQGALWTWPE